MDHKPHIWLINSHAEGNGGHDDIQTFHNEIILSLSPHLRFHPCMIGTCIDIVSPQHLGQLLHLLSAQAIDDAALALLLKDEAYDVLLHILGLGTHLIIEIGPIEGTLEFYGIHDAKALLDVSPHLVGGSGCECYDGSHAYLIDKRTDTAILGTEVMSPF